MIRKITAILLVLGISSQLFAQDPDITISLNNPNAYGIKIRNNFPDYTGSYVRAFTLSNQDGTNDFISLGAYGPVVKGVSQLQYGYIGVDVLNPMMSFLPGGNIGIGTTVPKEKLSVNGKIRAHEIKVETANWPDYVFLPSYQLPAILETEKHIKEKGHLPGIPSAEEVKANGVELGEMNVKLLQKIEELTLYIIDLEKRMKVLELKK